MNTERGKSLLIVLLVISVSLNLTQLFFGSTEKQAVKTEQSTQELEQKNQLLEDTLKERETKITELQNKQIEETSEVTEGETNLEKNFSQTALSFSKLALGGVASNENYDEELKKLVTDELYSRMTANGKGTNTGQATIKITYSNEEAFIDTQSIKDNQAKVLVKLAYSFENTEQKEDTPLASSSAYLLLTVEEADNQSLVVTDYEMG